MIVYICVFRMGVLYFFSGQNPATSPPRITNFLDYDLIKPEDVKFDKEYDAAKNTGFKLPCGAVGSNKLEWRWQHNGSNVIYDGVRYVLSSDGSLTGNYLKSENSGNYQCYVKDTVTNKETFSRKLQVAVTCK